LKNTCATGDSNPRPQIKIVNSNSFSSRTEKSLAKCQIFHKGRKSSNKKWNFLHIFIQQHRKWSRTFH